MAIESVELLGKALPEQFSFYHLGEVKAVPAESSTESDLLTEDMTVVAFSIQGEARGLLVMLFDAGLDASTYTEMGNIFASQMANRLSETQGVDVMISPPRLLAPSQLARLLPAGSPRVERRYTHIMRDDRGNHAIPVRILLGATHV